MLIMGRVGLYINTKLRTVSDEFQCIGVVIPAKAFAKDYVITGVGLSVCLFVCLFVTTITK